MNTSKVKVLIVADSLGLPRTRPERVTDDQSWPYLLAKSCKDYTFYFYCRPGLHSTTLVNELDVTLSAFEPDVIILQVGIVDCTPRALSSMELALVSRLPVLNKLIKKLVSKYRRNLLNLRLKQYVDIERFRANLESIRATFPSSDIIAVPIVADIKSAEARTPNLGREIALYNKEIQDVFDLVELEHLNSNSFMEDHYHLNAVGNESVYKAVYNRLKT